LETWSSNPGWDNRLCASPKASFGCAAHAASYWIGSYFLSLG